MDLEYQKFLPPSAIAYVEGLIEKFPVEIRVVAKRKSKHGDYRTLTNGKHRITLNAEPNPYRFLITCIHEIAHLVAFQKYGSGIRSHGKEWKHVYTLLMNPLLHPEIFPENLLPFLNQHFKNPKAATDSDSKLIIALQNWDPTPVGLRLFEIPLGERFRLENGRTFIKGPKRRTRFLCTEIASEKQYLVVGHAPVEKIQ